ncbi:PIN domain-containing protein [Sphingobium sp. IP1]|uniref:type II toxin-antitoxin system VapC family toxin n=1 Tax=Sphingobium TaxID=165695 RepID=UPI000447F334|nr:MULTISPECIES: type II toxin-antitoxin system VapC family toxin [Sphingobium]EZP70636.1 Ribonuclease VapC [Sphingomonas paucimobilis]PHP16641.1 PIN domain-containing protein [Sphingobium sp. IP1]WRD77124.1 type II toxin-antitoxin system VapC family toxin [Sphingobium baderi]
MIVLDTNVISEAMKPSTDPSVIDWLNRQPAETLFLTSVTLAELLFGISALPEGKRKHALASTLDGLLKLFGERILPFETKAAQSYAALASHARAVGKGFPTPDGYIAAIAKATGFSVATRDTAPFDAVGVTVINPWIAN